MSSLLLLAYLPLITASGTSPSSPSYVPDPSGRGTIGLLWSCILTLWPCVWTSIHLHMPRRNSKWYQRLLKKLKYAALTLIFPEVMLTMVVCQFVSAWRLSKEMNSIILSMQRGDESQSSLQEDSHEGCSLVTTSTKWYSGYQQWTLTTAFFGLMGGFHAQFPEGRNMPRNDKGHDNVVLTPYVLIRLAKANMLPPVSSKLCKGRGKSDEIGKLFVIGQVSWFVLNCIGRKASNLPVTLIEINTAVHVACAIAIYLLMWCKPQNATEPITISLSNCADCEHFINENSRFLESASENSTQYWHDDFDDAQLKKVTLMGLGLIYGGLHAVAWDAHFPSYVEQILWRVAVVVIIASTPFYFVAFSETLKGWLLAIGWGLLCFLPRLYLVVEAFISVRSLPVGAYETVDWVEFLPHIG